MNDRRERYEAQRRRALAAGLAASLGVHAAALAFVKLRVEAPRLPAAAVRLLPPVRERLPEPTSSPTRVVRVHQVVTSTPTDVPAPAEPLPGPAAALAAPAVGSLPEQTGEPAPPVADAGAPAVAAPQVAALEGAGQGAAEAAGDPGLGPGGVPLYEPGTVGRAKRGWLTAAGLNPRGGSVAIWVVGCPAPRTIVSASPTPTYRGRTCH